MADKYYPLLEALLEQGTVTIAAGVSVSAIRKGLNSALKSHNDMQALMELPQETRTITIKRKDGAIILKMENRAPSFKILE